jgi:Tol biopolymer transport system component
VWTLDLATGAMTPVTTADERAFRNVWAPDGDRIAFTSQAQRGLFWKNADGTGIAERLTQSDHIQTPSAWTPDGKILAFVENHPTTGPDIWGIDVSGSDRPKTIVRTDSAETHPAFSPDGRWLAYASNDSGRFEVYVQPFPVPGRRVPISTDSGSSPAWRGDGKELYYVEQRVVGGADRFSIEGVGVVSVMAVRVHAGREGFSVGTPRKLFEGPFVVESGARSYDVTPDGQRFLMVQVLEPLPQPAPELILVTNWFEELRRLVPAN